MSDGDDVRLEGGRGCVVCINEKIGIKVHGGEREKKFYKNNAILLCWVSVYTQVEY